MLGRNDSSFSNYSPPRSTSWSSPGSTDCEADDEGLSDCVSVVSGDEMPPHVPLSVSIPPSNPSFYVRKPTLREILSNKSSPPWTLTALMAYLSNNHCLEVLEFTMDAGRYKKHYIKMMHKAMERSAPPLEKDVTNTQILWQRLIDAYIRPNGSREINIPSEVRDPLLQVDLSDGPPPPDTLDRAIAKVYELMEDSVLVPFLESVSPTPIASAPPVLSYDQQQHLQQQQRLSVPDSASLYSHPSKLFRHSQRSSFLSDTRSNAASKLSARASVISSASGSSTASRRSPPETFSAVFSRHRLSGILGGSPTSASSSTPHSAVTQPAYSSGLSACTGDATSAAFPGLTDDSAETGSMNGDSPTTPGISSPSSPSGQRLSSSSANWKRLGRWSGWKSSSKNRLSQDLRDTEMSDQTTPI